MGPTDRALPVKTWLIANIVDQNRESANQVRELRATTDATISQTRDMERDYYFRDHICNSPDFQVSFMHIFLVFCEGTRRVGAQTRRVGSRFWTRVRAWTRRVHGMDSTSPWYGLDESALIIGTLISRVGTYLKGLKAVICAHQTPE